MSKTYLYDGREWSTWIDEEGQLWGYRKTDCSIYHFNHKNHTWIKARSVCDLVEQAKDAAGI